MMTNTSPLKMPSDNTMNTTDRSKFRHNGPVRAMPIRISICCMTWVLVSAPAFAQDLKAPAVPAATAQQLDPLNEIVDRAITTTSNRFLDADVHTPWQIIHGLLSLRENYVIKQGGKPVNAIDWISNGAKFRGTPWFQVTKHGGRAHPYNGTPYEFEGHTNQFLAVIAMCNLPLDHEFVAAGGQKITMQQMVDHAKMSVSSHEEITWTLWFLTQYVDQDEQWFNEKNEPWSMERLVRMQVKASPYDAPCGGTHGMFALAYARNSYLKKHGQLRGAWLEADQKLQRYLFATQRMQNRDGSFATNWFKSVGYSNDFNERIKYSGHMLEWIVVSLPKSRLKEQWIRTAVQTLSYDLIRNAHEPADCGPLYHALHALVLYREQANPNTHPLSQPSVARTQKPSGDVTNPEKPSGEATPNKPVIKKPVQMATQPEELKVQEANAPQRRTSSVEQKPVPVEVTVPVEKVEQNKKQRSVLMPILKQVAEDGVVSSVSSDDEFLLEVTPVIPESD